MSAQLKSNAPETVTVVSSGAAVGADALDHVGLLAVDLDHRIAGRLRDHQIDRHVQTAREFVGDIDRDADRAAARRVEARKHRIAEINRRAQRAGGCERGNDRWVGRAGVCCRACRGACCLRTVDGRACGTYRDACDGCDSGRCTRPQQPADPGEG